MMHFEFHPEKYRGTHDVIPLEFTPRRIHFTSLVLPLQDLNVLYNCELIKTCNNIPMGLARISIFILQTETLAHGG